MNRWTVLLVAMLLVIAMSCSGNNGDPVAPESEQNLTTESSVESQASQTHLWGYYNVTIDIENQTVEAVTDRTAMFAANVVTFLNGNPANLAFGINSTDVVTGAIEVDIDVSIKHPFTGMPQYNGYDVRGIFIGDESSTLAYDSDLDYAEYGTSQFCTNPDGYTRWFNPSEFTMSGITGFTDGLFASAGYTGDATLNPYKYFTDDLAANDDLWTHLNANPGDNGVFSSGTTNTRNYLLDFPVPSPGVFYDYAVVASWKGDDIANDHPANCIEAPAIDTEIFDDLYYVDAGNNGGNLILDVEVWGWSVQPDSIIIDSGVLTSPYVDNSPVGTVGGANSSVYSFDIPAFNVTQDTVGMEWAEDVWIVLEYSAYDYDEGEMGAPAPNATLAAFFRYDLYIASETNCDNLTPNPDNINSESPYAVLPGNYTGWVMEVGNIEGWNPGIDILQDTSVIASATNVTNVGQDQLTFDLDLSLIPPGVYDVRVTNGCGDQIQVTEEGMLIVLELIESGGTPNIDIIGSRGTPKDIACNPATYETAINYDIDDSHGRYYVWNDTFTASTGPHAGYNLNSLSKFDGQSWGLLTGVELGNTSDNFCLWNTLTWVGGFMILDWYDDSSMPGMKDVSNSQNGDSFLWGIYDTNAELQIFMGNSLVNAQYTYYNFSGSQYNGSNNNGVVADNILGIDKPIGGYLDTSMYILEDIPSNNTAVVELWDFDPTTHQMSFGQTRFYDALDITVASTGTVYVLEINADGYPVIWGFDDSGEVTATSGPLDTDDISGAAISIECDLYADPDELHVLHSDGVTTFDVPV